MPQKAYMWKQYHSLLLLVLVALVAVAPPPAQAQQDEPVQVTVQPVFQGYYSPSAALPLRITAQSNATADLTLVATEPDSPTRFTQHIRLEANQPRTTTLYLYPTRPITTVQVLVEQAGRPLLQQGVSVIPTQGMVGMLLAEPRLPPLALPTATAARTPPVVVPIIPAEMPEHIDGLANLAVLLVPDVPPASLTEAQQATLLGWVWQGGHLITGGGAAAAQTVAWLPDSLPQAAIGAPTTLDTAALAQPDLPPPPPLPGVLLEPPIGSIVVGTPAAPLWVQTAIGRGQLTQLAFEPGLAALNGWAGAPQVWAELLQPAPFLRDPAGSAGNVNLDLRAQQLTAMSGALPAPAIPVPLPVWGVLLLYLLGTLGLTLWLVRRDLTSLLWTTLPLLALLFAGIGFGVALALRPDTRLISEATLLEQIAPGYVLQTTSLGVSVPTTRTQTLLLEPATLLKPHRPNTTSRAIPIIGFAGDLAQGGRSAVLASGGAISGALSRWITSSSGIEAYLEITGDEITANIRNTLDQPLREVVVAYGAQVVTIDEIAPGETASVVWAYRYGQREPQPPPDGVGLLTALLGDDFDAFAALSPAEQAYISLVQAALSRGVALADPGPWLFARIATPPARMQIEPPPPATISNTVLVVRPPIQASGEIALPNGWLRADLEAAGTQQCQLDDVRGIQSQATPVTLHFQLPPALTPLQPSTLTLYLEGERRWPTSGVRVALYDWRAAAWIALDYDGPGALEVPEPARYMQDGQVRLRLDGRISEVRCIFASAAVRGSMP